MVIMEKTGFATAQQLIRQFKGDAYVNGWDVLNQAGKLASEMGKRALLVRDGFQGSESFVEEICESLNLNGIELLSIADGAAPNAPREDLYRIQKDIHANQPELVISFGGGSTIDAVKAAIVLEKLGGSIEDYFGTGLVIDTLENSRNTLIPHLAIQTASSSGAHLTKYSNITDIGSGQKKLIVDDAIIPARSLFDYKVTLGSPPSLTADGALDGISHSLEVLYSAVGKPVFNSIEPVSLESIRLIVQYLPQVLNNPSDPVGRIALGLATDLGGYAIMLGGTNGAHLTSFSLVDAVSHGRACGMLNPYYTVFFAPAVVGVLRKVASIYREHGYLEQDPSLLDDRELGLAAAGAMINFEKQLGLPTTLAELPGFTDAHIERALSAAKNPQLKMKLQNMPVPMSSGMVDEYMQPILMAAKTGRLELVRNVRS